MCKKIRGVEIKLYDRCFNFPIFGNRNVRADRHSLWPAFVTDSSVDLCFCKIRFVVIDPFFSNIEGVSLRF
jgi:hypothetical protein